MNNKFLNQSKINEITEKNYEGIYGAYKISKSDISEVYLYRFGLLLCALSLNFGLIQWIFIGPDWSALWFAPIGIFLGIAIRWIHIYLRPLHNFLYILWAIGCFGIIFLFINHGAKELLSIFSANPINIFAVGPFFAAITGIGFKEFFCFRRIEAIGLTLFIPASLVLYMLRIISSNFAMALLLLSSIFMLILSIRKLTVNPVDDIGDKSVFNFLNEQKAQSA
tara:strand:+ start:1935 stop:2603 length:669 start_codon:yes stop_codon:yes gene_type:complete